MVLKKACGGTVALLFLLAACNGQRSGTPAAGLSDGPERFVKNRFPLAELSHTFLTSDSTAFCGVMKTNEDFSGEEPLRLFFVDLDTNRVRITGDLDVNATTYLSKCAVDPNSNEASSIRERWAETEKALKGKSDERRAQAAQQRQHERWVNENADALRALQQATDDIQAGKR